MVSTDPLASVRSVGGSESTSTTVSAQADITSADATAAASIPRRAGFTK